MIVEDGTGLNNANSYVESGYADDYFSVRSNDFWSNLEEEKKESCLIRATDYIDSAFKWLGTKKTQEQALKFPRKDLIDTDGYSVDDIPNVLKMAVCECALLISKGTEMFKKQSDKGAVTSETIGALSFSYDASQKIKDSSVYDSINLRLRGLYEDSSKPKIYSGKVSRA